MQGRQEDGRWQVTSGSKQALVKHGTAIGRLAPRLLCILEIHPRHCSHPWEVNTGSRKTHAPVFSATWLLKN